MVQSCTHLQVSIYIIKERLSVHYYTLIHITHYYTINIQVQKQI